MAKGTLIRIDPEGKQTSFRCRSLGGPTVEQIKTALSERESYFTNLFCIFQGKERTAYVDEDGDPKSLPVNRYATRMVKEYYSSKGITIWISKVGMVRGNLVVWVPDEPKRPKGQSLLTRLAARSLVPA